MQNFLRAGTTDISTDIACALARKFLIESSQPLTDDEINVSLLDKAKLDKKHLEWMKQNPDSDAARRAFELRDRLELRKQQALRQSAEHAQIDAHRKQIAKHDRQGQGGEGSLEDELMEDMEERQERLEKERELQSQRMFEESSAEKSAAAAARGGAGAGAGAVATGGEGALFNWNSPVVISEDLTSLKEILEKKKGGKGSGPQAALPRPQAALAPPRKRARTQK